MIDKRQKDKLWSIPSLGKENEYSWEAAQLAVLMDLRDELRIISRRLSALECPQFIAIPRVLRRISANTMKRQRKKSRARP